jgi:nitrate reductase NapE component
VYVTLVNKFESLFLVIVLFPVLVLSIVDCNEENRSR